MKTGADVSFLFSGAPLALVSGIGEIIEPLDPLNIFASVVFPDWSVETKNAYSGLDRRDGNTYPLDEAAARTEAEELLRKLRKKERAGLLPNDFAPLLMEKFPNYGKLFGLFERSGYCAWGITGSGGAAFALSYEERTLPAEWPSWVRQVLSADMR
jgi:4-diphosphocytidyl-2-C-methyl-D-erythritol kinase